MNFLTIELKQIKRKERRKKVLHHFVVSRSTTTTGNNFECIDYTNVSCQGVIYINGARTGPNRARSCTTRVTLKNNQFVPLTIVIVDL